MSNEGMANSITDVPSAIAELLAVNKQLEQELQKTMEQLEKCESALNNYAICDDVGTVARRYFKDKPCEALEGDVNYQVIEQLKESAK